MNLSKNILLKYLFVFILMLSSICMITACGETPSEPTPPPDYSGGDVGGGDTGGGGDQNTPCTEHTDQDICCEGDYHFMVCYVCNKTWDREPHNYVEHICEVCGVDEEPHFNYIYSDTYGGYMITGFSDDWRPNSVSFPEIYNDIDVVGISANAFKDETFGDVIIISQNIKIIEENAFSGVTTELWIHSQLSHIGENAFKGCTIVNQDYVYIDTNETSITYFNNLYEYAFSGSNITQFIVEKDNYQYHAHTLRHTPRVEPTCTSTGIDDYYTCDTCDVNYLDEYGRESYSGYPELSRLPHTIQIIPRVEPTCTSTGTSEGEYCTVCENTVVVQYTINKIPHYFDSVHICTVCDSEDMYEGAGVEYVLNDSETEYTFSITSSLPTHITKIIIPRKYNDKPVTAISDTNHYMQSSKVNYLWIGDNVKAIPDDFYGISTQKTLDLYLGNSLESIGSSAFKNCKINDFALSNNITEIKNSAFMGCTIGDTLTLNEELTTLESYAFADTNIRTLNINDKLKSPGAAFRDCGYLSTVNNSEAIEYLNFSIFENCANLSTFKFSTSLKLFADRAFLGTSISTIDISSPYLESFTVIDIPNLKTVTLTNCPNLKNIEYLCGANLKNVSLPPNLETLKNITGTFTSIELPSTLTSLQDIINCPYLYSLDIPKNTILTYIWDCPSLREISYEKGNKSTTLKYINCTNLETVVLPIALQTIQEKSFYNCVNLTGVTFIDDEGNIADPKDYSLNNVGTQAFYNCNNLTSINLGDNITSISREAFRSCSKLQDVYFGKSLTSMGYGAFIDCTSLKEIILPNTFDGGAINTATYECVFTGCYNVEYLETPYLVSSTFSRSNLAQLLFDNSSNQTIPSNLKKLHIKAPAEGTVTVTGNMLDVFDGVVEHLILGEGLTRIERLRMSVKTLEILSSDLMVIKDAYDDLILTWDTLETLTIVGNPNLSNLAELTNYNSTSSKLETINVIGTTPLQDSALAGFTNVDTINIADTIPSIGNNALEGCSSITSIIIGSCTTTIGDRAFLNCTSLKDVTFNATTMSSIGAGAFRNTAIESIVIPEGITSLQDVLRDCSSLVSVTLPSTLENADAVVMDCTSLQIITLPANVTTLFYSFSGCTNLVGIIYEGETCPTIYTDTINNCTNFKGVIKKSDYIEGTPIDEIPFTPIEPMERPTT